MKARRRRLKRNREAQALQAKQFQQKVVPNKKKDLAPPVEIDPLPPVELELPDEEDPVSLVRIPITDVMRVWPLCQEFIEAGCSLGDLTENDVYELATDGAATLWFVWSDHLEAAGVTQLLETSRGKVFVVLSFGGKDMRRWLGLLDEVEIWAKAQGAKISRTIGRKGWGRVLKDYRPAYFVYEKEL